LHSLGTDQTQALELAAGTLAIELVSVPVLVQGFLVGATQSPSLIKSFLPLGSPASQVQQIGDLSTMLERMTTDLKEGFDRLMKQLMTDVGQFVSFASTGAWSGQITADYADNIKHFDWMLKTHILSESLKANHYWGRAVAVVDQEWWNTGGQSGNILKDWIPSIKGRHLNGEIPDGQILQNMFRSNATGQVYELNYKRGGKSDNGQESSEILKMFGAYGWANMEVLFDGAVNCTSTGNAVKIR